MSAQKNIAIFCAAKNSIHGEKEDLVVDVIELFITGDSIRFNTLWEKSK